MTAEKADTGWVCEEGLRWRQLKPFGVEVGGDLSVPLAESAARRFYRLLDEHGLILARQQTLSMEQQQHLLAPIGPDMHRAHAKDTGYITTEAADAEAARAELSFHSDNAYTDKPFAAISLHALDVVDQASSTRFVHAVRAYDSLHPDLRLRLDALQAEMIKPSKDLIGGRVCDVPDPQAEVSAVFDAVRINPRTGRRFVAVSEMQTARLLDVDWEEGRSLLHEVYDHLYAPENSLEHRWRNGDLVIWDNIALQHARGPLAEVGRRVLQRVVACS